MCDRYANDFNVYIMFSSTVMFMYDPNTSQWSSLGLILKHYIEATLVSTVGYFLDCGIFVVFKRVLVLFQSSFCFSLHISYILFFYGIIIDVH